MTVVKRYLENHCQIVYQIDRDNFTNEESLAALLDDLDTALDYLIVDVLNDNFDYFSFEFLNQGMPLAGEQRAPEDELDPWNDSLKSFLVKVYEYPDLHSRIMAWVDRVAGVLESTREESFKSVWEDDKTQLGEPLVSVLAMKDCAFIPAYTKLLVNWDMEHEVNQSVVISEIFKRHGICEETEKLLYCRVVTNPGQFGEDQLEDLFPDLQDHYGNFPKSLLFREIVTKLHAKDAKWRAESLAAGQKNLAERRIFFYTEYSQLREQTELLLAQLDAEAT